MSKDNKSFCTCGKSKKSLSDTEIGKVVMFVAGTAVLTLIWFGILSVLSRMATGHFSAINNVDLWGTSALTSAFVVLILMYIFGYFDPSPE